MKTEAFIMHMGLLILFYFLGTTITVVLLNFYGVTFAQVSYIFLSMGIISLLLAFYYRQKMLCVDCRTLNRVVIAFLILMSALLLFSAYDMMQPWELSIF